MHSSRPLSFIAVRQLQTIVPSITWVVILYHKFSLLSSDGKGACGQAILSYRAPLDLLTNQLAESLSSETSTTSDWIWPQIQNAIQF